MDINLNNAILAVITTDKSKVGGGGVPIFYANNEDEREKLALYISKVTMGMVHDLENGCYIIVRH